MNGMVRPPNDGVHLETPQAQTVVGAGPAGTGVGGGRDQGRHGIAETKPRGLTVEPSPRPLTRAMGGHNDATLRAERCIALRSAAACNEPLEYSIYEC